MSCNELAGETISYTVTYRIQNMTFNFQKILLKGTRLIEFKPYIRKIGEMCCGVDLKCVVDRRERR